MRLGAECTRLSQGLGERVSTQDKKQYGLVSDQRAKEDVKWGQGDESSRDESLRDRQHER